jgi:hypothetical protein
MLTVASFGINGPFLKTENPHPFFPASARDTSQ